MAEIGNKMHYMEEIGKVKSDIDVVHRYLEGFCGARIVLGKHFATEVSDRNMSNTSGVDDVVQQLQQFSTCDVSDALFKLKLPHCGFLPGLTLWSPHRQAGKTHVVGQAYTVKYVLLSDTISPTQNSHYIDSIPPGAVVFVSSAKTTNAAYGGMMSTRAQVGGAAGTVVDGRIRDLEEHRKLGYPVFARDVGTAPPYEVMRVSEVNVPAYVQGEEYTAVVNPGDIIIGDLNGVVCLPVELAESAIVLMKAQREADAKVAMDINKGVSFAEASRTHRTTLTKLQNSESRRKSER